MRTILSIGVMVFAAYGIAYCGQSNRIVLTDGSVINGEVVSFANGTYVVHTSSMGQVSVDAGNVSVIETGNAPQSATAFKSPDQLDMLSPAQIEAYKEKMMSDPRKAAILTDLTHDTQIQAIANDREVQAAVQSGDLQSLMQNDKFMNMVNSTKVQDAVKELKQQGD